MARDVRQEDVADFLSTCIGECEGDGYQQQIQGSDQMETLHEMGISYGYVTHKELWVRVGDTEFRVSIRKLKK